MQSEKAYYRRIAGFFNAGRPVATPAGPANLVLKEGTPWYQKSFLNLYRHTAGTVSYTHLCRQKQRRQRCTRNRFAAREWQI